MHAILKALVAGIATIRTIQAIPLSQNWTPSSTAQPAATVNVKEQLFRDLLSAPTANKRFQRLLVQGESLVTGEILKELTVFNFNSPQPASGAKGGAYKLANIETFPIVAGLGISMAVGYFEPCGINTPHIHPRATEFFVLMEGSNVKFGYILENGLVKSGQNPEIAGILSKYEGTVFPQGSIHFQFNEACEKATFVAAFDSVDPGTSQVAQNFFNLDAGVVNATLGFPKTIDGSNIKEFRKTIPANLAQDVDNCLAKCRL
ncbi:RmlC-like cupin domain-containing protein [Dendryphion nanum]|uniref:RmlC-like cupin domain-containing protein n=1 Tax=Dendryphion nanum TaxID=256645 RepID=A0A9P9DW03_9PLEO|nr:RmlC-like cupin domain-containing protein [Dendryphion nanum]